MNPLVFIPLIFAFCQPISIETRLFDATVQQGSSITEENGFVSTYVDNGIVAHNNLEPGNLFQYLEAGDIIAIQCKNGEQVDFVITDKQEFRADDEDNFTDSKGKHFRGWQLFRRFYNKNRELTLLTCIQNGDDYSWGRLFITAKILPRRNWKK